MAAKTNPPQGIMTAQEIADYLQVHPATVYKLARKGELPGFKVGSDWRFRLEQIDRWFRERSEGPR
jgi:excisionase family DNA binding protein